MRRARGFVCGLWIVASGFAYGESKAPIEVVVRLSPVGSYVAKTSAVEGDILLEKGKVVAPKITVMAGTLKTGIELRDKHTVERLQVKDFPKIELTEGTGEGGKGEAKIKIKGIEKKVTGTYELEGDKLIKATFKVSLKDFGIEKVKYLGVGVKDEVEINVQLPLKKSPLK